MDFAPWIPLVQFVIVKQRLNRIIYECDHGILSIFMFTLVWALVYIGECSLSKRERINDARCSYIYLYFC